MTNIRPVRSLYPRRLFLITFLMAIIAVPPVFAVRPIAAQQHGGRSNDCTATPDNGTTEFSSTNAAAVQDAIDAAANGATVKVAGTCVGVQPVVVDTGTLTQTVFIMKSLTIEGGYAPSQWNAAPDSTLNPTTLAANRQGRVVVVPDISNGEIGVTLSHLTIRGGDAVAGGSANSLQTRGGGIIVQLNHAITIAHSMIISNTAVDGGGIFNAGTAKVLTTTIANNAATTNGGGMVNFNSAHLTVRDSAIVGNQADRTGGIRSLSSQPLLIENSTLSGNSGRSLGSAFRSGRASTLINVTISGNTETGSTGAVRVGANDTLTLTNSIVANSSRQACNLSSTSTINVVHSIVDDTSCRVTDGVDGNIIADPLLASLQDNSGPTVTHALFSSSPAINSADSTQCPTTDQRGIARDMACDMGAFEFEGVPTAVTLRVLDTAKPNLRGWALFTTMLLFTFSVACRGLFEPTIS